MTTRRALNLGLLATAGAALAPRLVSAQGMAPIALPPPRPNFGCSLGQALMRRCSTRAFAPRPLPLQVLAELLWAADGVNRPASGDRTAPTWRHARETVIIAVMQNGAWRYDPIEHRLLPQYAGDARALCGVQAFVATAPLNLAYASDTARMGGVSREEQRRVAAADIGFIGQNVYLYCASEGLNCVFRESLDTERLARTLQLPPSLFISFAQTVGYPQA